MQFRTFHKLFPHLFDKHTTVFSRYAITPKIHIILLSESDWNIKNNCFNKCRDCYLHCSAVDYQGLISVSFSPLTHFANTVLHIWLCTAKRSIANFSPWSQILKVRGGLTVGWWGTDFPASNVTWHTNVLPHPQQQLQSSVLQIPSPVYCVVWRLKAVQIQPEHFRFTTIVQKRLRIIMSKHSALKRQSTNFKSNKEDLLWTEMSLKKLLHSSLLEQTL